MPLVNAYAGVLALTACLLTQNWARAETALSAADEAQGAPFGLSWGSVGNVPQPSLAVREGNLTRLIYLRDRLPPDQLRDAAEIVLEVCRDQGLQQIIWISRVLSPSEEEHDYAAIVAEGTRRHGRPEVLEQGSIHWSAGRTT